MTKAKGRRPNKTNALEHRTLAELFDEPEQLKVLVRRALGMDPDEAKARAVARGFSESAVDRWVAAPSGPLARIIYERVPAKELRKRLPFFGLIRLAVQAGLTPEDITRALDSEPTHEGVLLRILLLASDEARDAKRIEASLVKPTRDYLRQRFALRADVLAGDEATTVFGAPDNPQIIVHWDNRDWYLGSEQPGDEQWELVTDAVRALGWKAYADARLAGRLVWNGQLTRLERCEFVQRDDPARAALNLYLRRTDYIEHLATNYGFDKWRDLPKTLGTSAGRKVVLAKLDELKALAQNIAEIPMHLRKERGLERDVDLPPRSMYEDLRSMRFDDLDDGALEKLRKRSEQEDSALRRIVDSPQANCLSVNVAYVTADNYLVVQKRSPTVGHGLVDWQTSAAGFVAMPRDQADSSTNPAPSIWNAIEHETREELNPRNKEGVKIVGVVREARNREVGIMAIGRIPEDLYSVARAGTLIQAEKKKQKKEIRDRSYWRYDADDRPTPDRLAGESYVTASSGVFQPASDSNEVDGLVFVPFDPRTVFRFVREVGSRPGSIDPWANVMPLGALSWIFALVHDNGGNWDYVANEWKAVFG